MDRASSLIGLASPRVAPPVSSPRAALHIERLCADERIRIDDLTVREAECVALLGPNGAGKTTLFRIVAGLDRADEGSAQVCSPIAYVAQDFRASLLPWFSVAENITLPLRRLRLSRAEVAGRLGAALSVVPIARDLLDRRPHRLSGGQQQLVTLARALVSEPRLLLLDEPFSALDLATRVSVSTSLANYCCDSRIAALVTTHDLTDAARLATRAVAIAGRPATVVYDGPLSAETSSRIERAVCSGTTESTR